jgi:hypothetical protein
MRFWLRSFAHLPWRQWGRQRGPQQIGLGKMMPMLLCVIGYIESAGTSSPEIGVP